MSSTWLPSAVTWEFKAAAHFEGFGEVVCSAGFVEALAASHADFGSGRTGFGGKLRWGPEPRSLEFRIHKGFGATLIEHQASL
ncbi:hypothetical protein GUJ93_ZPchr0006g41097 [Zizania palustris]|uniref:Uncharacterized protein n=1 Tax=Zizania palustris TaxID=103762 RepID=A0A8J5SUI9_ZIZPA|nr:hypothetical protein GUJ93_ZPchr0006g41097 [Zizania palustris]